MTERHLQPLLHELVGVVLAPTSALGDTAGQIRPLGVQGVFHADARVLSRAELRVDDREPEGLTHGVDGPHGARKLELALFRTDGALRRLSAGTSRPLRDPAEIRALFVERLAALNDDLDPGFGFDMARLSVTAAEPFPEVRFFSHFGSPVIKSAQYGIPLSSESPYT